MRIVDDLDHEVRPGRSGELIVRTQEPWTLSTGYFGMPDKTAEAAKLRADLAKKYNVRSLMSCSTCHR